MPALQWSGAQAVNVNIPTTTETVVATLSGITTDSASRRLTLFADIELATGVGTTAVAMRIRRGVDTTGPVVGVAETATAIGAAGSADPYSIEAADSPGEVNNQSYVVTIQQTGATGNGTAQSAQLTAIGT